MLNQLSQLSSYQKRVLLQQAESYGYQDLQVEDSLISYHDPEHNEQGYLAGYKCDCGALIAEDEEVGELGACPRCGANYLGLDEE
jgi:hypothetical protein